MKAAFETSPVSSRRQFLMTLGGTASAIGLGTGTVAAQESDDDSGLPEGFPEPEEISTTQPPSVPESFPTVSTDGHFTQLSDPGEVSLVDGETPTSYDLQGDWSGFADADEIQVYVHGFVDSVPHLWGRYQTDQARTGLRDAGYTDAFTVAFTWDSDVGWADANEIAERNALKFGQWVRDIRQSDDRPIRIIAHSLGARVTCSLLEELHLDVGRFYSSQEAHHTPEEGVVDSVALLGGAIDNDAVQLNRRWGEAIEYSAGELYNYYSDNDAVLGQGYSATSQTDAVGYTGIAHQPEAPENYTDRNVTDDVQAHGDYDSADNEVGVLDDVVEDFGV